MKKENIWKSIGGCILLFLLVALFLAIAEILSPYLSGAYIIGYSAMIIFLYKRFKKDIKEELKSFKKDFKDNYKKILPISFIGIILVYIINAILLKFIGVEAGNQIMAESELKSSVILISIYTILLAPIVEEYIFKLPFKHNKDKRLLSSFIIALLFTLLHFYPEKNPLAYLYLISYFILGLSFTYPFYKTNNTLMSIIIHSINNLINVVIILFI